MSIIYELFIRYIHWFIDSYIANILIIENTNIKKIILFHIYINYSKLYEYYKKIINIYNI